MSTSTIKLPPLSVLLAPREHVFAPSANHETSAFAYRPAFQPQPQPQLYTPQLQVHHHPQQEQLYDHYAYASSEGSAPSAPGSPASPTWWATSPSPTSHALHPVHYAPQPSSAPFWKHTSGLEAFRTLAFPHTDSLMQPIDVATSSDVETSATVAVAASATGVRPKKSRYLREMDRRAIIRRLDLGEKQCALAREFSVSRSSICNLFKHRAEVLSRAAHQSPFSKHPKKCKKPQPHVPRRRFA